jgi:hypothetical protein
MMTVGKRRKEEGEESSKGRGQKGRLIQERDRWGLAWVGMNRVVREKTLGEVLFPGRDGATFGNRVWELARDLKPVGAYWTVYKRTLDDGGLERYLALTEIGYRQAEEVLGRGWFQRRPVEKLKPSHVVHDLELADFALALLPRRKETYQPKVKGKAVGLPVAVDVPYLPTRWRWYHASVFRRLTVLEGMKDEYGRFTEKPEVALAYDPDAILETDTHNCTRYFIEWDRGTEPVGGAKETRTILDKLRRAHEYFWEPRGLDVPGRHWSRRRSYYLDAFKGDELRRPKVLIVTRSAKRAHNIWKLAVHFFRETFNEDQLLDFLEVLTIEQASSKLRKVLAMVEARERPAEMPWVAELRATTAAAAKARADAERKAREAAAAHAAAQEKRRLEIEELRRQGKWKTHEDVERERREVEEAERRRQAGVLGKLKGLVGGRA